MAIGVSCSVGPMLLRRVAVAAVARVGVTKASLTTAAAIAARGPAFASLQTSLRTPVPPEDWTSHGKELTRAITGQATPAAELDAATTARIYHLALPVYFFCRERVRAHRAAGGVGAVAIGLSAPQGCGKTTLVDALVERFAADGLGCAVASFDDFYLKGADQDNVAAAHPSNPMLQVRGNAGTHDLDLGTSTLQALKRGSGDNGAPLRIPRYDKSQRGGRGDRAPEDTWTALSSPPDVVLLEGWMAGFSPLPTDAAVLSEHAGLPEVNNFLEAYSAWHDQLDAWVVLALQDPSIVYTWRLQAEQAMAKAGRPGMSDEQVADFVSRYMPAYHAFCPGLYAAADEDGAFGKPTLLVQVDETRGPVPRTPAK